MVTVHLTYTEMAPLVSALRVQRPGLELFLGPTWLWVATVPRLCSPEGKKKSPTGDDLTHTRE